MKLRAACALFVWTRSLFVLILLGLSACNLPRPAGTPVVYDFGPGNRQLATTHRVTALPPLEVSAPRASSALAGQAVLYRLVYADVQELKPYTLARWSMPPAQLIDQRLRERLALRRAVVSTGELLRTTAARRGASAPVTAQPEAIANLRLELEEFSQLFETPEQSAGLLRLRATLTRRSPGGDTLLGQRNFVAQQVATTPDAAGGVHALATAADQVVVEVERWLDQVLAGERKQSFKE